MCSESNIIDLRTKLKIVNKEWRVKYKTRHRREKGIVRNVRTQNNFSNISEEYNIRIT